MFIHSARRRRFIISAILIIFSVLLSLFIAQFIVKAEEASFEGSGVAGDPYVIKTAEQLDKVRENLTAHYKLGADIDLSGYDNWDQIGKNFGTAFQGTFDGDGHTIKNLTIIGNESNVGLFGYVLSTKGYSPVIKNIQLENIHVTGNQNVGGLIGRVNYDTFR